jgi:hypothetical protein
MLLFTNRNFLKLLFYVDININWYLLKSAGMNRSSWNKYFVSGSKILRTFVFNNPSVYKVLYIAPLKGNVNEKGLSIFAVNRFGTGSYKISKTFSILDSNSKEIFRAASRRTLNLL